MKPQNKKASKVCIVHVDIAVDALAYSKWKMI